MSSELELLRQRVTKLEAENTGLKQIIGEIANLRIENTRLNQIIKLNRTANDSLQIPIPPPINDYSDEADSVNLEQTQIAISPEVNSNNISGHIANTSDNAPSSDVSQPIRTDPKSSEDKTVDDFLDLKEKERVSKHKRDFELTLGIPTTPYKKELKVQSLALIEYG
nr:15254_t:CDS:2 [Entrophospora candida]